MIWERLLAHQSKTEVKGFLAEDHQIDLDSLPAYALELNAEEGSQRNVKQRMRNAIPETEGEIREQKGPVYSSSPPARSRP